MGQIIYYLTRGVLGVRSHGTSATIAAAARGGVLIIDIIVYGKNIGLESLHLKKIYTSIYTSIYIIIIEKKRHGVGKSGAESGVSGRTRLLLGTLAHALHVVVLHNAMKPPNGHETSQNG